jgi:hypothetical protein
MCHGIKVLNCLHHRIDLHFGGDGWKGQQLCLQSFVRSDAFDNREKLFRKVCPKNWFIDRVLLKRSTSECFWRSNSGQRGKRCGMNQGGQSELYNGFAKH